MLQNAPCKMLKNGVGKKRRKKGCLQQRWQRLQGPCARYIWPKPSVFLNVTKDHSLLCPARLKHNQVNSD